MMWSIHAIYVYSDQSMNDLNTLRSIEGSRNIWIYIKHNGEVLKDENGNSLCLFWLHFD